jgi:hypothetical protein
MNKLTEEQKNKLKTMYRKVTNTFDELQGAVSEFNDYMQVKYQSDIGSANREFNIAREKLQCYLDELKTEVTDHYDLQPEEWQKSVEGDECSELIYMLDNACADMDGDYEVEEFKDLDSPEFECSSMDGLYNSLT